MHVVFSIFIYRSLIDEEIKACSNFARNRLIDTMSKDSMKGKISQVNKPEDFSSKSIIISTLGVCSRSVHC